MYQDLDEIAFAEQWQADDPAVLLDVRTQEEYDTGYIAGARLLDFLNPEFEKQVHQLDKSKDYYVYCRSGNRSGKACQLMKQLGFDGHLYNLEDGILGWTQSLEY